MAKAAINMPLASAGTPPIITFVGIDIPIAAMVLGLLSLALVRFVKPTLPNKANEPTLTFMQNNALTAVLMILLFVIIAGEVPYLETEPLGVGMAVIWGIGLGTCGMLAIDLIGDKIQGMLRRMFGSSDPK